MTQSIQQPFDVMACMQQFNASKLASQQSQTIVIESHADKCRKSEAKFNNTMLQLHLVGCDAVLLSSRKFETPRIPTYTQAMNNIQAQPTLIQAIQMVNI